MTRGLLPSQSPSIQWRFLSAQHKVGTAELGSSLSKHVSQKDLEAVFPKAPPHHGGSHRSPSDFTELKARGPLPSSVTRQRPLSLSEWSTASLFSLTDEGGLAWVRPQTQKKPFTTPPSAWKANLPEQVKGHTSPGLQSSPPTLPTSLQTG